MDVNVICKFVSFKVNKIRWLNALQEVFSELDTFVTGSWDNEVSLYRRFYFARWLCKRFVFILIIFIICSI